MPDVKLKNNNNNKTLGVYRGGPYFINTGSAYQDNSKKSLIYYAKTLIMAFINFIF